MRLRLWLGLAAANGALAVVMGALAAHGPAEALSGRALAWIDTGARYQLAHAVALVAVSALAAGRGRGCCSISPPSASLPAAFCSAAAFTSRPLPVGAGWGRSCRSVAWRSSPVGCCCSPPPCAAGSAETAEVAPSADACPLGGWSVVTRRGATRLSGRPCAPPCRAAPPPRPRRGPGRSTGGAACRAPAGPGRR